MTSSMVTSKRSRSRKVAPRIPSSSGMTTDQGVLSSMYDLESHVSSGDVISSGCVISSGDDGKPGRLKL